MNLTIYIAMYIRSFICAPVPRTHYAATLGIAFPACSYLLCCCTLAIAMANYVYNWEVVIK